MRTPDPGMGKGTRTGRGHGLGWRARLLAAGAVLVLVAAGCKSSGGGSGGGGGSDMTLNVGRVSNSVAFLPFYVAERQGYFAAEGVKLGDQPVLGTGAKVAAALSSGSIDIGGSVMTDVLNMARAHQDVKLLAPLVNAYYIDVTVSSRFAQPSGDLNAKIMALKGRKIGITGPGSGTEALLVYLFKQVGLDTKKDATLMPLGSDATAALGALKSGRVDALSLAQPVGELVEAQGIGTIYISPSRGDIPSLRGATQGVAFTTQSAINRKGKAIAAFLRAIAKAEQLIHSDAATTQKLLAGYQPTMKPATVEKLVPILRQEIPATPTFTQQGYQTIVTFHTSSGLVSSAPPFASVVPTAWINQARAGG